MLSSEFKGWYSLKLLRGYPFNNKASIGRIKGVIVLGSGCCEMKEIMRRLMSSVQKFQKSQVCFSFLWFTLPSFFCNWSTILIHPIALFSCNLLPPPYISLAFWLQEYSPKTLVILITPPPIDEEGRNEYARYDFFFLITAQSF